MNETDKINLLSGIVQNTLFPRSSKMTFDDEHKVLVLNYADSDWAFEDAQEVFKMGISGVPIRFMPVNRGSVVAEIQLSLNDLENTRWR